MATHLKTHYDLDAVGGRIVLESARHLVASTTYHTYDTIDDAIQQFIVEKRYNSGDLLVIADICPTQGVCEFIEKNHPGDLAIRLLDHHKTRSWVNKYSWAKCDVSKCGTELVFEAFYIDKSNEYKYVEICKLVEAIAAWDLWKKDSSYRVRGENLNTLLGFIGKDAFVRRFVADPNADLFPTIQEILGFLNARKERYVGQVLKEQLDNAKLRMDGLGNSFKTIFATDFMSEIGDAVLAHPDGQDLHYVCLINPTSNTCSLRSRTGENDVSTIAKRLGGGGHQAAAGFPVALTDRIEEEVFTLLNGIELF